MLSGCCLDGFRGPVCAVALRWSRSAGLSQCMLISGVVLCWAALAAAGHADMRLDALEFPDQACCPACCMLWR